MTLSADTANPAPGHRLRVLDGWRALSILLVLAGHMLPLGPAAWEANAAIAANGMAIFFTLSGFLIVSILQRNPDVISFLVRRLMRIIPLAWLALAISLAIKGVGANIWLANFLFYANLPPFFLDSWSSHFWSLDVEMQFYVGIALLVLTFGRRGLYALPVIAPAVTALRIATGTSISIVTWMRVDEILAGGVLALVIHGWFGPKPAGWLGRLPFPVLALLFLLSTRPELLPLDYARPYLCAAMVGITIVRPIRYWTPVLESRPAAYLAQVSYAVYILHHYTLFGWLGSGHGVEKYLKRPISFLITFGAAHVSTFYFEKIFIDWSHRFAAARKERVEARQEPLDEPVPAEATEGGL
ncbi:MAG: putative Acyltransferase 3 [Bradyrhizobium sp.]|nr:putative Acyltransferase 3 [Bradyrhizobium sp.]